MSRLGRTKWEDAKRKIPQEKKHVVATRILLVDDFVQWRLAVRTILEAVPGFRIIGEASNGLEAIEKTATLRPDIVLLDIGMPILNGIEAARRIRRVSPQSRVIFLTQEQDSDVKAAALAVGGTAYLLKSTAVGELRPAIDAALQRGYQPQVPNLLPLASSYGG
jgi:DNA-binding NarL/FixJ family response regulator